MDKRQKEAIEVSAGILTLGLTGYIAYTIYRDRKAKTDNPAVNALGNTLTTQIPVFIVPNYAGSSQSSGGSVKGAHIGNSVPTLVTQ